MIVTPPPHFPHGLPGEHFPRGFSVKILYARLVFSILVTCSARDTAFAFTILTVLGKNIISE